MERITAACDAMATRFELVLHGQRAVALRAAAEEAIREIQRIHAQLSLYLPSSEISYINSHAGQRPVPVEPRLFALLQLARHIHHETAGAFDITIAPLVRCWGFMAGSGRMPAEDELVHARSCVGMQHVIFDDERFTVQFARPGMMVDLGSIGKGYALEMAVEILREAGVESALVHGGTSTVCGIGAPPDGAWKVAIEAPRAPASDGGSAATDPVAPGHDRPLAIVELRDTSLSVSGVHGKCFRAGENVYGHVIDPRSGAPAQSALLAGVVLPSATETDAFSTALLLGGLEGQDAVSELRPGMRTLVLGREAVTGRIVVQGRGIVPLAENSCQTS